MRSPTTTHWDSGHVDKCLYSDVSFDLPVGEGQSQGTDCGRTPVEWPDPGPKVRTSVSRTPSDQGPGPYLLSARPTVGSTESPEDLEVSRGRKTTRLEDTREPRRRH